MVTYPLQSEFLHKYETQQSRKRYLSPIVVTFILNSDQIFKCIPAFVRVNSYKWVKRLTR